MESLTEVVYSVIFEDGAWYRKPLYDLQPVYEPKEMLKITEGARKCINFWLVRFFRYDLFTFRVDQLLVKLS